MKNNILSLTKEQIEKELQFSKSQSELLYRLGFRPSNNNYLLIRQRAKELELNLPKFDREKNHIKTRPLTEYLSNKYIVTSHDSFKKRLIKENYFKHECGNCHLTEWLENKIPLELHHIDGNRQNNILDNLQLLCPNCHALTSNYRGKNIGIEKSEVTKNYCECGQKILAGSKSCKKCNNKSKRPSKEQLIQDKLELRYFVQIGKKYGVSDNAVRKWFKFYNIEIK